MKQQLYAYLLASENSRTREAILRHRFVYDVSLAAARRGYALQVYLGEVDRDGFDIVLDDADFLRKVQLKSVLSSTESWPIKKKLLLPEPRDVEDLGFVPEQCATGLGGGVVLQDVTVRDDGELDVAYSYTDVAILRAFERGWISRGRSMSRAAVAQVLAKLIDDTEPRKPKRGKATAKAATATTKYETRVEVPRGAFIRVHGANELLAIIGLASTLPVGRTHDIVARCRNERAPNEAEEASAQRELLEVLERLSPESLGAP